MFKLDWSSVTEPNKDCPYTHIQAPTPFGRFLLTWKGWKDYPAYGFDETPWDTAEYHSWSSVDEAKQWAEKEFLKRLKESLLGVPPDFQQVFRPLVLQRLVDAMTEKYAIGQTDKGYEILMMPPSDWVRVKRLILELDQNWHTYTNKE